MSLVAHMSRSMNCVFIDVQSCGNHGNCYLLWVTSGDSLHMADVMEILESVVNSKWLRSPGSC